MAIAINATLVVQGINFFITYLLLRRFLFKPTIVIIEHQEAQNDALNAAIKVGQKVVEVTIDEQHADWRAFHSSIREKIPTTGVAKLHKLQRVELILEPQTLDPVRLAQLTDQASAALVKRVERV